MAYVHDYFGNYRDPMWEVVEGIKTENQDLQTKIPDLEAKIEEIKKDITRAKKATRAYEIYKKLDPEATDAVSTKHMVAKLSGNAKFDVDTVMSKKQFYYLLLCISSDPDYQVPNAEGEGEGEAKAEEGDKEAEKEGEKEEAEVAEQPEEPEEDHEEIFSKMAEYFEASLTEEKPSFDKDFENLDYVRITEKMREFVAPEIKEEVAEEKAPEDEAK